MKAPFLSSPLPWIVRRRDWKDLRQALSPLWSYSPAGRVDVSGGEKVLKLDRPLGRRVLGFDSSCTAEGCGGRL
jgi:hypothetical protein